MKRVYEGEKLIKKTIYLEKEDVEIFERYALLENKSLPILVRAVMSKFAASYKQRLKQ